MSTASLAHLIVPGIVFVLLAITTVHLSRLTFNKGVECGQRDTRSYYLHQIRHLTDQIGRAQKHIIQVHRQSTLAMQQLEERHQRQLEVFEEQRKERERDGIILERRQIGEIINLLRVASPLLHSSQQYQAARSAEETRQALQKRLLQLRLVEHRNENAAAGEGTA